jgi:hypothetical protein
MKKSAVLLSAVLFVFVSALCYAQAPVPFINLPLIPDATAPGGGAFTLTLNGTGFVSNSVVNWNGKGLATQFVNGSQLTATVPGPDIATANTAWVTVVNPAPSGGTSNTAYFTVAPNVGSSVGFGVASSPAVNQATSIAVGDFNGDGKMDLAIRGGDSVFVLLGDGKGNFSQSWSMNMGWDVNALAAGDFNGDGNLDLVILGYSEPTNGYASILLGDGTGGFTVGSSPPVGDAPLAVAVGDFNADGKLDLAVANFANNTVSILLGDGTGNFNLASTLSADTPDAVAVGDFNGDGKLDLVVVDDFSNMISAFLGDGTGNFTLTSSSSVGTWPQSIVAGDFNGDGNLDLAVADYGNLYGGGNIVSILLGDGKGNFTLTSSPATGIGPYSVATGDFNGDGHLDLAVANYCGNDASCGSPGAVSILLGDGAGNFAPASSASAGYGTMFVAVGDFSGNGKLGLAAANNAGTVSILARDIPAATLSLSGLNFGTQLVNTTSSPQTVTLTNTGGATLNISGIAASTNFHQRNNCGSHLAMGASCTITVIFTPRQRGTLSGSITIADNAFGSPQTISLTGISTALTVAPSNLDFGSQTVGTASAPQTVTVTNSGSGPVSIFGVHLSGSNPGAFTQTNTCGTSVPAHGSCTINVTFKPEYKGQKTATLEIGDNGGNGPQAVTLTGTGTP